MIWSVCSALQAEPIIEQETVMSGESQWLDDDDYEPQDECEHDNYEIDILTGRAECDTCYHSWPATSEEIAAAVRHQRQYHEWEERENRRQWWRDLFAPITGPVRRTVERFRIWRDSRTFQPSVGDDEIPF